MKKILYALLLILIISISTYFLWVGRDTVGSLFFIMCVAMICLYNLDKLKYFRFYGLEAELQQTITEANATIDQLKSLALILAEPTISLIATNGISPPMPLSYRLGLVARINEILERLSIAQQEIQRINEVHVTLLRVLHQRRILEGVVNPPEHLRVTGENGQFPTPEEFEQFLVTNNLSTEERQERILDLQHFIRTGGVRRPDAW